MWIWRGRCFLTLPLTFDRKCLVSVGFIVVLSLLLYFEHFVFCLRICYPSLKRSNNSLVEAPVFIKRERIISRFPWMIGDSVSLHFLIGKHLSFSLFTVSVFLNVKQNEWKATVALKCAFFLVHWIHLVFPFSVKTWVGRCVKEECLVFPPFFLREKNPSATTSWQQQLLHEIVMPDSSSLNLLLS